MAERRPRPWADWVDRKVGTLYQRALQVFFLAFALVCFWVASKIWATASDLKSWLGFVLVVLAGLACAFVAARARKSKSMSDWLDQT